jgi:hypothetical protein
MNYLTEIKKYAKNRENAYRIAKTMGSRKMKAISNIKTVADFFSGKNETVQLRAVARVEEDIMLILPHPDSRYSRLRTKMLDIIAKTKEV